MKQVRLYSKIHKDARILAAQTGRSLVGTINALLRYALDQAQGGKIRLKTDEEVSIQDGGR